MWDICWVFFLSKIKRKSSAPYYFIIILIFFLRELCDKIILKWIILDQILDFNPNQTHIFYKDSNMINTKGDWNPFLNVGIRRCKWCCVHIRLKMEKNETFSIFSWNRFRKKMICIKLNLFFSDLAYCIVMLQSKYWGLFSKICTMFLLLYVS